MSFDLNVCLSPRRGEVFSRMPLPMSPTKIKYPEIRPSWWDGTHRNLAKLVKINQKRPLEQNDTEVIEKIAESILNKKDPIEKLIFLKLLSDFIIIDTQKIFFDVLSSMLTQFPEIETYFEEIPFDPIEIVFTPQGIKTILSIFTQNFMLPENIFAMLSRDKLPIAIENIMQDKIPDHFCQGWILYDHDPLDSHFSTAFAQKKDGKVHVFVFDSLGHKTQHFDVIDVVSFIKHFDGRNDLFEKFIVYSYKTKRQYSPSGCSVFAIYDLKHLLERIDNRNNLVDFYKNQDKENQPRLITKEINQDLKFSVYELNILPPELEKSSQSFLDITKFLNDPPKLTSAPRVARFNEFWECIEKDQDMDEFRCAIESSSRFKRENCLHNLYLQQKRLQLMVNLLTYHFKYQSHTLNSLNSKI